MDEKYKEREYMEEEEKEEELRQPREWCGVAAL